MKFVNFSQRYRINKCDAVIFALVSTPTREDVLE